MKNKLTYEELEILLQESSHLLDIERSKIKSQQFEKDNLIKSVLNSYDSPVVSLDKDFCYTSFNNAHESEMLEIYDANIELGSCIHDYITSDKDRNISKLNLSKVLNGDSFIEIAFYGNEVRKCYEIIYSPILDNEDDVTGISVFLRDITKRKQLEEEKNTLINSLQDALNEIKTLKGIIPICSYCHNIRNEKGSWDQLEAYISNHSNAQFSHGMCPSCLTNARTDVSLDE